MTTRSFHLGDVLSVATGILVSLRGIGAVYDVCNFMTGDKLFTHQLPRASQECAPEIYRQHPDLHAIARPNFSGVTDAEAAVKEWLAEQAARFGEYRELAPLASGDHTVIDPLDELAMAYPNVKVIPFVVGGSDA